MTIKKVSTAPHQPTLIHQVPVTEFEPYIEDIECTYINRNI